MRIPFVSRWLSSDGRDTEDTPRGHDVPWWVPIFTDWGRPLAAVVVLVLCAPGEKHLAELVGWHGWLSWGWAGLLSLYAGISAVVATVRPRGTRGKLTAVLGAILSLLLAMAAQPLSHMFVTGWMTAEPRPPLWLVVTVSCIPPFILGHLLHLAASPVSRVLVPEDVPVATVTQLRPRPAPSPAPVPAPSPAPVPVPAPVSRPVVPSASPVLSLTKGQQPGHSLGHGTGQSPGQPPMSSRALSLLQQGLSEDVVKDKLKAEYTSPAGVPPKTNTINTSVRRAKDKVSSRP